MSTAPDLNRIPANLDALLPLATAIDCSLYAAQHMSGLPRFGDRYDLLKFAAGQLAFRGLVLEFGVCSGSTINTIADCLPDHSVYGFDSFKGLPEQWTPGTPAGHFAVEAIPEVRSNVELVIGLFGDTLPGFLREHAGRATLIHVDCDLYSSTKTALAALADRITTGTVIVFDEYFNYVGWRLHEFKAFQEFCRTGGISYEYIGLTPAYEQVAVRITGGC